MTTTTAHSATLEKIEVLNRWTNATQFTATIEVTPDMTTRVKLGLAVRWARKSDADLSDADLSDAPIIPDIHKAVYAAVTAAPDKFDMGEWHGDDNYKHPCDTTHCRAGWVVALAGDEGRALESRIGTPAAATLIYLASDPKLGKFPSFYCGNAEALADMKRLAEQVS